ncbi:HEPN domain-containing protein [Anaerobacterium chartisolvens]|uniref:HEPN domain-containing protein n=1 Tax=Anaerobacterium chartisolvens TaxID=1297424 RepID=A0A369B6W0_9FIRM|nr:HEPN domain-containing protein [Anaerobacterium chartisolvens]RCX16267.1 HEPN domain-containing protein [Anaerobacterium chartisolvens]
MVDSIRHNEWLEKAHRDLKSAKVLKQNDCGNDMVAFHCQQAIEKSFKGFLLKQTGQITEGHSLVYLCKEASHYNIEFKKNLKDCAFVNQYYIETRYPADVPLEVSDEEADECIFITERLYNMVLESIRK